MLPADEAPSVGSLAHEQSFDDHECAKCHQLIQDTIVNALGQTWHESCFVCNTCGAALDNFFGCDDGFPYCADHIDEAEDRWLASETPPPAATAAPSVTNAFQATDKPVAASLSKMMP